MAPSGLSATHLSDGSVTTLKIADSAVTTAKIAAASVTNVNLQYPTFTINGVTGNLGDSFVGLNILKKKKNIKKKIKNYFVKKYYLPELPFKLHKYLNDLII